MKTILALAVLALAAPLASGAGVVQVTLQVGDHYHLLPAATTCAVTVPEGARGAAVLDAAVAAGCIARWTADDFGVPGEPNRFVTCIDDRCQTADAYWVFSHTQATPAGGATLTAAYGIDDARAAATEGAVYDFRYGTLVSFFLP